MNPALIVTRPVPGGPRAYRGRIRGLGPIAGLLPPGALGAAAWLLHRGSTSAVRGAGSFLLAVLAAPGLLVAGVPLRSGGGVIVAAAAGSGLVWLLVGVAAARRATRRPVASWRDFWREYIWLAAGLWVGVALALLAVNFVLGRPIL